MSSESWQLVEMAMGYSRSRIVCAAARLHVADALANGERTVSQLAAIVGADAGSLHRLLRALASVGIVVESVPGTFALTNLGQPLRRDVPNSAWPSVVFWADLLADNWSYLTECVRTGDTAARLMERAGVASRWSQDPEANNIFRAVMGTAPVQEYTALLESWHFASCRTVADLGGGGGSLLIAILNSLPDLTGMLVDRPASIDAAARRFDEEGLRPRCRLISADLIDAVPAGADVYLLQRVLHGYDDARAVQILRNCASVLPRDGRVLIIEFVLPAVVNQTDRAIERTLMSDLNMLAVTGGKERTEAEFARLLAQADLDIVRTVPVPDGTASIVEARGRDLLR